jgi:hypothetical protein
MVLGRRPHQCGFAEPRLAGVDVCSGREQPLHSVDAAAARRRQQDGLACIGRGVRIGAGLQQRVDRGSAAIDGSQGDRTKAVAVRGCDVCARAQQHRDELEVVVLHRPVQGRGAISLRAIHFRAVAQQRRDGRVVPALHGRNNRRQGL